jgi:dTDP-4-dehydrorhamnose reductase
VRDIATKDYPTKARRPANSRLSSAKFASAFGWTVPDWRASARIVVGRLINEAKATGN